jgi:hypothetical protein
MSKNKNYEDDERRSRPDGELSTHHDSRTTCIFEQQHNRNLRSYFSIMDRDTLDRPQASQEADRSEDVEGQPNNTSIAAIVSI